MRLLLWTCFGMGISSVIGTAAGLLFRNDSHRVNDVVLGAASGIMLAAAILGLILPASGAGVWHTALPMTVTGVFSGAVIVSLLDKLTPHLHRLAGLDQERHAHNAGVGKILLFIAAIALHKIPEGLAAGVSFGTGDTGDILTVAGSLALQNIPEAMVIATPLVAIGVSTRRTLGIASGIGIISIVSVIAGYFLVALASGILPFILAFAGGAMLYVISDEMIPETHAHGYEKNATFALSFGFLFVLVAQRVLATL